MASIRKRGKSWQVQVRSRKAGAIGKSFHRKADAERWAVEQEALMQTGQFAQMQTQDLNLADLMEAYAEKVTPVRVSAKTTSCIRRKACSMTMPPPTNMVLPIAGYIAATIKPVLAPL